ncbi:unnamed protein product [Echinostoma caproni]|uniref:Uncharacterized protein n=1 Tax=Echinostoma caproni TaxID=27848 RepID=A0A183B766_9TREM|nr:unnamed protein product [Echinostoma caproni]
MESVASIFRVVAKNTCGLLWSILQQVLRIGDRRFLFPLAISRHLGTLRYYLVPRFANKRLRLPRAFLSTSGNETLGGRAHIETRKKTSRQAVNTDTEEATEGQGGGSCCAPPSAISYPARVREEEIVYRESTGGFK